MTRSCEQLVWRSGGPTGLLLRNLSHVTRMGVCIYIYMQIYIYAYSIITRLPPIAVTSTVTNGHHVSKVALRSTLVFIAS